MEKKQLRDRIRTMLETARRARDYERRGDRRRRKVERAKKREATCSGSDRHFSNRDSLEKLIFIGKNKN